MGGDHACLLGVAAVERLDGDGQPEAAAAGFMGPDALHLGHARSLQLIPHGAAAIGAEIEGVVIGGHGGDGAQQDRVIPVHHGLDADGGLGAAAARVIAGPFAQRAFLDDVVGIDIALEGDLGVGGHGHAGLGHADGLDRFAEDAARRLELALAIGNFEARQHEHRGVHAHHHGDRARLALVVIFVHEDAPVLAGGNHDGSGLGAMHLHAIGAVVDPAGVRILHDHEAGGANEGATIMLVPDGRGDLVQIHRVALHHILHEGAAVDLLGGNGGRVAHIFAPPLHQLHVGALGGNAQRHVDARHGGQDIRQHPRALGIAGDLVEEHRRIAHLAHVDIDDAADLLLGLGALDDLEFAHGVDGRNPVTKILVRHAKIPLGSGPRSGEPCRVDA